MPQPTRQQQQQRQGNVQAPTGEGNGAADNPLAAAVESLLSIGTDLQREKAGLLERIGANRDTLRNLAKQGAATPEQAEKIGKMYPERQRKGEGESAS